MCFFKCKGKQMDKKIQKSKEFYSEMGYINLQQLLFFCCSKFIFECRNGFNMLKNS